MKKLRNERGEMLVELMTSVLVVALSVALLIGCVMFSYRADEQAEVLDENHYAALTAADAPDPSATPVNTTPVPVIVQVSPVPGGPKATLNVKVYGDSTYGLYSYRR